MLPTNTYSVLVLYYLDNVSFLSGPSFRFKVVSYNVLAQVLLEIHPYLYSECYSNDLKWKVRADRIYNEIVSLAPDVSIYIYR